jgi:hypothetical protein
MSGDGCYRKISINRSICFIVEGSQFLYLENYTYHLYNQCSYHLIICSLEHTTLDFCLPFLCRARKLTNREGSDASDTVTKSNQLCTLESTSQVYK